MLAYVALRALERIVERSNSIVAANLPLLDEFFERRAGAVERVRPQAGAIGFPRLTVTGSRTAIRAHPAEPGACGVDRFCHELASEAGVLLLPGSVYGDAGKHFRIGFGRRDMPDALARLDAYLGPRLNPVDVG